jgi:predicted phosphodiesterase
VNKETTALNPGGGNEAYLHAETPIDKFFDNINAIHRTVLATIALGSVASVSIDTLDANSFVEEACANIRQALADEQYHANDQHDIIIQTSDFHGNFYMAHVVAEIAKTTGAKIVIDCGDMTNWGIEVNSAQHIINIFESQGIDVVSVTGNHDTVLIEHAERAAGATVLTGQVEEVSDYRFAGDSDPNYIIVPKPNNPKLDQLNHQIAEVVDGTSVDFVVKHNPSGEFFELIEDNTAFMMSGHKHAPEPSIKPYRNGAIFDANNTNGQNRHLSDPMLGLGIGRITRPVTITVLMPNRQDPIGEHTLDGHYLVKIETDGSVEVSDIKHTDNMV